MDKSIITIKYKDKIYNIKKDKLFYVFKLLDEVQRIDNKEYNTITEEMIIQKLEEYKLIDEIFLESVCI